METTDEPRGANMPAETTESPAMRLIDWLHVEEGAPDSPHAGKLVLSGGPAGARYVLHVAENSHAAAILNGLWGLLRDAARRESRAKRKIREAKRIAEAKSLWSNPTYTGQQVADRTGYAKSNLYLWFGARGRAGW